MNLKPLGDRVILQSAMKRKSPRPPASILASGAPRKSPRPVLFWPWARASMDKDGKFMPMPVKVGDNVIYSKYGGTEVAMGGEERADPARRRPVCGLRRQV